MTQQLYPTIDCCNAYVNMSSTFKQFITEKEVEEVKKKRQEEWEKVRRPDQPLGRQRY